MDCLVWRKLPRDLVALIIQHYLQIQGPKCHATIHALIRSCPWLLNRDSNRVLRGVYIGYNMLLKWYSICDELYANMATLKWVVLQFEDIMLRDSIDHVSQRPVLNGFNIITDQHVYTLGWYENRICVIGRDVEMRRLKNVKVCGEYIVFDFHGSGLLIEVMANEFDIEI